MPPESNQIFIRDLELSAVIGVHEWERAAPQSLLLDLDIALPDAVSCRSDRIEDTIDYAVVVERLRQELAIVPFALVEAAAERLAQLLLHEFGAPWVRISVAKTGVIPGVRSVGARIERATNQAAGIRPHAAAGEMHRSEALVPA